VCCSHTYLIWSIYSIVGDIEGWVSRYVDEGIDVGMDRGKRDGNPLLSGLPISGTYSIN
jgi:hypothetical protein